MKFKRHLTAAALVLGMAVVIALAAWHFLPGAIDWPVFPASEGAAPVLVVDVEPDFGYRTGDIVPVTLYVRQAAHTTVDVGSLALEGDFEIRGEPEVKVADAGNGVRYLQIKLALQSFAFKDAVSGKVSMTWNIQGEKQDREIPATTIVVHTSRTWDGRQVLQEGPQTIFQGHHLAYTLLVLIAGLGGLIASIIAYVRIKKAIPKPVPPVTPLTAREIARRQFNLVWAKIAGGDLSDENFREIDRILRKFLGIETVLLAHVSMAVGQHHPYLRQILFIIGKCEAVIFKGEKLSVEDLEGLRTCFGDIILKRQAQAK